MDPLTMMMLAQAVMGGINGAKQAKQSGQSPIGGFVQGGLGGATQSMGNGGSSPFAAMFGGGGGGIGGGGGAGVPSLPRMNFGGSLGEFA